jgi:hypothetical protein
MTIINNKIMKLPESSVKEILSKFKDGDVVHTQEELNVLQRYQSTGMVSNFKLNHRMEVVACLTDQGKWFLKQAKW